MRIESQRPAVIVLAICVALLPACGVGGVTNPRFEPEISNRPDSFEFQATGLDGTSQTLRYTWQNTGTIANVNQSSAISSGTATLVIRDAAANQVYSRDLSANGTFVTARGGAGAWAIELTLSNVRGTLNFRVQKRE